MNEESLKTLARTDLDAFGTVFGSPSLLTTESPGQYRALFDQVIEALQPNDGLELLLFRQVLQESWKILRYERHQTLGIDRRVRQRVEFQSDLKAQRLKKREALAKKLAERTGRTDTELSQMAELCDVIETTVEDIDVLAERGREHRREHMHNQALEAGIIFQEQLDRLISAATKRRDGALQQLEHYRAGVGRRLKELTDHIIDGEVVELNTPDTIGRRLAKNAAGAGEVSDRGTSNRAIVDDRTISAAPATGGDNT
jgi:hypothetical protein